MALGSTQGNILPDHLRVYFRNRVLQRLYSLFYFFALLFKLKV